MSTKLLRYLPAIVWMAVIFYLSHQPGNDSSETSHQFVLFVLELIPFPEQSEWMLHLLIRKLAHFIAYAILALLIFFAYKGRHKVLVTLTLCLLFAISDEIHQLFIPGRSGEVRDVLIDLSGAIFGVMIIKVIKKIRRGLNV